MVFGWRVLVRVVTCASVSIRGSREQGCVPLSPPDYDGAMTTVSKAKRIWIMVGGGFVLALPVGLLMGLTSEGGFLEGLLSFVWLAGVVAWCVYVVKRWPLASRGGGVAQWVPAPDPMPVPDGSYRAAYMYHYVPLPEPGTYWVDARAGQVPGRMMDERAVFIYVGERLVGGCTPHWLGRYGDRLPLRLVLSVSDGEGHVLFPV